MKNKRFLLCILLAICLCVNSLRAQAGVLLAQDGKAQQAIIISPNAAEETKTLAAELQKYLNKITGAEFKIEPGEGGKGIMLGTLEEFPVRALQKPLELRGEYDGVEAFAIRTEKDRVLLLGRSELGVSHAAFRFLELIGYRHFFPAKEWEVIPRRSTLSVDFNETDRPKILSRRIWWGYGFFGDRSIDEYKAWARHNRMAESVSAVIGHAWQGIIAQNKAVFDAHPEYYALYKGERDTTHDKLELGNPAVRKIVVDYALEYFRKNPEQDLVSLDASDGEGFSQSPESKKLGTVSDAVFGIVNEAARAVQKEFPGKLVGVLAYSEYSQPPSFALEPNVVVQLTTSFITGQYSFEELMTMWPKRAKHMGYYDYYSVWDWDFDQLPGGRANDVGYLKKRIADFHANNALAVSAESSNNWGPNGRGYYLANRLLWNPQDNADAILEDFYTKAFGSAAAPMKRYYERLDRREFSDQRRPLFGEDLLATAFRDVQEASELAKDDPAVLARLDHIKQYLHYVYLRWQFDRETDKDKRKALFLRAMEHVFRTRSSYMNHWRAMQHNWAVRATTEFKEPTWAIQNPEPKPWATNDTPLSRAETEAAFQEGLQFFQPQPSGEEIEFSRDLVPVQWDTTTVLPLYHYWTRPVEYALYSLKGEPIKMQIKTGVIAVYRNKPEVEYSLRDADGKIIGEAKLPQDGETHEVEVAVPRSGIYFFTLQDYAAGWTISVDKTQPVSLLMNRDESYWMGSQTGHQYFYVPKGTRSINFFWNGPSLKLYDPSGKEVLNVPKRTAKNYSIEVPTEMDGKIWRFGGFPAFQLQHLWFYNIPNVLAASPHSILVPREVAEKDDLKIWQP